MDALNDLRTRHECTVRDGHPHHTGRRAACILTLVLLMGGCRSLPAIVRLDLDPLPAAPMEESVTTEEAVTETPDASATESNAGTASDEGSRATDPQAGNAPDAEMAAIRAEILAIPDVTDDFREQWLASIEAAPPAQRAVIIHTIRGYLAAARHRVRSVEREAPTTDVEAPQTTATAGQQGGVASVTASVHAADSPAVSNLAPTATASSSDTPPLTTDGDPLLDQLRRLTSPPSGREPTRYPSAAPVRDAALRSVSYEAPATASPYPGSAAPTDAPVPMSASDVLWQDHLRQAIAALEQQLRDEPATSDRAEMEARLRLLYVLDDDREKATRPIPEESPPMQTFWSQGLFALSTLLDPTQVSDPVDRRTLAKRQLDDALTSLSPTCRLTLRNACFCESIHSFGAYTPFAGAEFRAGQRGVYLYVEVENLRYKQLDRGYHASTRHAYQIFDSRGLRVVDRELGANEQCFRSAKRDYFCSYEVELPTHLLPDKYTLMLTVIDVNGQETATTKLDFRIVPSGF